MTDSDIKKALEEYIKENEWVRIMADFQKRLKYFRERKGLTQIELAKIVGLSHNQLSRYEKGHNTPNVVVLEWLCQALSVSSKDLLGF